MNNILSIYKPNEIAKYIRLSLSDDNINESESIINQRKIINEFIEKNGNEYTKTKEFIDDGISGTNFNRPGWINLLNNIENNNIKVVITKNLSRLGRSNYECSYYLDYYFKEKNIRYIAIQEGIDTKIEENSNNDYAALNNFINEKYSKDLSKNIRKVYKIKQKSGEYMGSIPLYGYIKDKNDKHKLIVDPYAANIVKKIFNLYLKYNSQNKIKEILYKEKVLIPEVYKKTKRGLKVKDIYNWNIRTIKNILTNEMYIGNMVQNVHSKKSFREKKLIKNNKEDWIIINNTHEAIIDKNTFNKVNRLLDINYKSSKKDTYLLSGLLYCKDCLSKLGINKLNKGKYTYLYTICNNYKKNNLCKSHSNNYIVLEKTILDNILNKISNYIDKLDYLNIYNSIEKKDNIKILEELNINLKEIDIKLEKIYLDRLDDIISLNTYKELKKELLYKKEYINNNIKDLSKDKEIDINKIKDDYKIYFNNNIRNFIVKIIDKIYIDNLHNVSIYYKVNIF